MFVSDACRRASHVQTFGRSAPQAPAIAIYGTNSSGAGPAERNSAHTWAERVGQSYMCSPVMRFSGEIELTT